MLRERKGAEISKLWDHIRLELVLGVQFSPVVEAAREMGWFVQTGPDGWLCHGLRLPGLHSHCIPVQKEVMEVKMVQEFVNTLNEALALFNTK